MANFLQKCHIYCDVLMTSPPHIYLPWLPQGAQYKSDHFYLCSGTKTTKAGENIGNIVNFFANSFCQCK